MDQLIKEYREAIKKLENLRRKMSVEQLKEDGPIIGSWLSNLRYSLEWMKTGRRPGSRRGVENRSYDQRTMVMNPLMIQCYVDRSVAGSRVWVSEEQSREIDEILSILTPMERDCYLMAYAGCYSRTDIATELNVSKGTVNVYMKRAKEKIAAYVDQMGDT